MLPGRLRLAAGAHEPGLSFFACLGLVRNCVTTPGPKKTDSSRADVPGMHLRISQAYAAVELEVAAERGAMLTIALSG